MIETCNNMNFKKHFVEQNKMNTRNTYCMNQSKMSSKNRQRYCTVIEVRKWLPLGQDRVREVNRGKTTWKLYEVRELYSILFWVFVTKAYATVKT